MAKVKAQDLREVVRELLALLDAHAVQVPSELRQKAATIATERTKPRTDEATAAKLLKGRRSSDQIMMAALRYRVMNRDNPGSVSKGEAAERICEDLRGRGRELEDVTHVKRVLTALWPGKVWSHPPKPAPQDPTAPLQELFGDEDAHMWLFRTDKPIRPRKPKK